MGSNDNFIDEINTTIESILIEEKKQNDEILNDSLLANDNVNHKNGDEVIRKDEDNILISNVHILDKIPKSETVLLDNDDDDVRISCSYKGSFSIDETIGDSI